jgi:hypothetical protein
VQGILAKQPLRGWIALRIPIARANNKMCCSNDGLSVAFRLTVFAFLVLLVRRLVTLSAAQLCAIVMTVVSGSK